MQLLRFLSKAVIKASSQFTDVMVCSMYKGRVLVNTSHSQSVEDFDTIVPCNHQEADSRIYLYLSQAAQQGHSKAFIRTVDIDVFILAVGHIGGIGLMELWIGKELESLIVHPRS